MPQFRGVDILLAWCAICNIPKAFTSVLSYQTFDIMLLYQTLPSALSRRSLNKAISNVWPTNCTMPTPYNKIYNCQPKELVKSFSSLFQVCVVLGSWNLLSMFSLQWCRILLYEQIHQPLCMIKRKWLAPEILKIFCQVLI